MQRRNRRAWFGALCVAVTLLPGAIVHAQVDLRPSIDAPHWRVYALEYARSDDLPATRLVQGAPDEERVAMSWYFFVAVGQGVVLLIDCGTDALVSDAGRRAAWRVSRAVGVPEALGRVGLRPRDVTDVVLTHHHWDHVGGLRHFRRARVHMHTREWRRVSSRLRAPFERAGRARLFSSAHRALWPGVAVRVAGRHTSHQLQVQLRCRSQDWALVGDAAYLYRNIERREPVAVSADPAENVRDVQRAVEEFGVERVVPGHDPLLFERHPSSVEGVAALCP